MKSNSITPDLSRPLFWIMVAVILASTANRASASVLVDDFSEVSDPGIYPIVKQFPNSTAVLDTPLSTTFGDLRIIVPGPGFGSPVPNPLPDDISITVDIDTSQGMLTSTASPESTTRLFLGWGNQTSSPPSVDVTGEKFLLIEYSATTSFGAYLQLGNADEADPTGLTAALRHTFMVPAATNGRMLIALSDVNEPVFAGAPNGNYPPTDLTSLDSVVLDFVTTSFGAELVLDRVIFVPEPASAILLQISLVLLLSFRRRRADKGSEG